MSPRVARPRANKPAVEPESPPKEDVKKSPKSKTKSLPEPEPEPKLELPVKSTKGRKPKYNSDDERKEARREQNKLYRERKRKELEDLRRAEAKRTEVESDKSSE